MLREQPPPGVANEIRYQLWCSMSSPGLATDRDTLRAPLSLGPSLLAPGPWRGVKRHLPPQPWHTSRLWTPPLCRLGIWSRDLTIWPAARPRALFAGPPWPPLAWPPSTIARVSGVTSPSARGEPGGRLSGPGNYPRALTHHVGCSCRLPEQPLDVRPAPRRDGRRLIIPEQKLDRVECRGGELVDRAIDVEDPQVAVNDLRRPR